MTEAPELVQPQGFLFADCAGRKPGRWLMQDRQVGTLDAAGALADAVQVARTFKARVVEIDRAAAGRA